MVLKDENLCHMWKFTRNDFFFEHLSGRDSKTVNFFAWFLEMVCSSKRYRSCIFFLLARGTVGVIFFDLLEKHILFSDGRYWFQMLGRHLETGA